MKWIANRRQVFIVVLFCFTNQETAIYYCCVFDVCALEFDLSNTLSMWILLYMLLNLPPNSHLPFQFYVAYALYHPTHFKLLLLFFLVDDVSIYTFLLLFIIIILLLLFLLMVTRTLVLPPAPQKSRGILQSTLASNWTDWKLILSVSVSRVCMCVSVCCLFVWRAHQFCLFTVCIRLRIHT